MYGSKVKCVTLNSTNCINDIKTDMKQGVYFLEIQGEDDAPYWTKMVKIDL